MRKALLALCLLATPALAATTYHIRLHITDSDGDELQILRYTPKTFDSLEECQAFLEHPDDRYVAASENVLQQVKDAGLTATTACEADPE